MADRQDIDALLVGAVYGELDAADRARLDEHLSTSPQDRAALEALEQTRAQVRRGLDELPAAEPRASISALLLQEAARRAPRAATAGEASGGGGSGLWARFLGRMSGWMRPAMSPAFAGAMALLLVAGTATTLWLKGGQQVSEPVSEPEARAPAEPERSGRVEPPKAESFDGAGAAPGAARPAAVPTQTFHADLDQPADPAIATSALGGEAALDDAVGGGGRDGVIATPSESRDAKPAPAKAAAPGPRKKSADNGYLEVRPRGDAEITVKDVDEADAEERAEDRREAKNAVADKGGRGAATGAVAAAPPPAPEPTVTRTTKPMDPKLEQWAKSQHARLARLVGEGKCPDAGRVGAELKDRAPEYYAAHVANDRAVRACKQYIEAQAKKKAEKDYKSRSQSNTADEAELSEPTSK